MSKLLNVFVLVVVLAIASHPLVAQDYEKIYKRGTHAFYIEDFSAAEYYFKQLAEIDKPYRDSEYLLEISVLLQKDYRERSLDLIIGYRSIKGNYDKFYYYWLGRIFANRYMFPEAVEAWGKFMKTDAFKSGEIRNETRNFIDEVEKLVTYFDNPDNYEIHQLEFPVNSAFSELSPAYFADGYELIFASNRDSEKTGIFSVYHSTNRGTVWKEPTQITSLGSFKRKEVNLEVIDEDGKLFLYEKVKGGDLFYSEPDGDNWTVPKEFDSKITSTHMESHFYLNETEDRIIFAAKMGKMKLDLLESYKDMATGEWSDPVPFSSNIDTEYNEDCPYLDTKRNKLYFCSDRPGGIGGYDVYVSTFDSTIGQWGVPENLGWPINSPDDELHFKFNHDMNSGYFSSNRIHSLGGFDIFFFWGIEKTTIEGRVIDAVTGRPFKKGEIRFHPSQYTDEYFRSSLDSAGRYKTNIISDEIFSVEVTYDMDTLLKEHYEIHEKKGEHLRHSQDFYVFPKDMPQKERVVLKEKLYKESEHGKLLSKNEETTESLEGTLEKIPELNLKGEVGESVTLQTIYFEYGTSNLTDRSTPTLQKFLEFMQENNKVRISIEAHTDNVGHPMRKLAISKRRAIAVKNWLLIRGISDDRMETIGHGGNIPIASNDVEEGGRELNRRIEIKVVQ